MAYTKAQARKIAEQIHSRFGSRIASACSGTPVPPEFVAGLIGVEAGKDRQGRISETATRFEPHVFAKLKQVRDGSLSKYNRVTRANLQGASDAAIRALSHSYGLTQVMGWWTIHLGGTVAELRDPNKHLNYTVKLLMLNSADGDFERRAYAGEFREWNSGSERGKTYHVDYVANATAVMEAYKELGPASLVTDEVTEHSPQPKAEEPDKGETTGTKPADETSGTPPPAPAVEVKASEIPFLTRLASLSVPTGIITAIGAVMAFAKELPPYAWIAFSAITVAAMIIGYLIYRDSKKEAHERTKIVLTAAADPGRNNLRLV